MLFPTRLAPLASLLPALASVVLALAQEDAPAPAPLVQEPPATDGASQRLEPLELDRALSEVVALRDQERLEEAREHLERILAGDLYVALREQDSASVLRGLRALDGVAESLGLLPAVRRIRTDVVRHLTERCEPDAPELLTARGALAIATAEAGAFREALPLFEELHATLTRLRPPDDEELLLCSQNLGIVRRALGDLEGSRELLERVFEAREKLLPPEHPDLLATALNLAGTIYVLGDLERADELYARVHDALERRLPPDDLDLFTAKASLATTRLQLGDLQRARELAEAANEGLERRLPPDHPRLLQTKQILAVVLSKIGELEGARAIQEEVLAILEPRLPPGHPDLTQAQTNLAATLFELRDHEGAAALTEAVIAAQEELLPPEHPNLLATKGNLAAVLRAMGDLEGALAIEREVHDARVRILPPEHPMVLLAKSNLSATLGDLGQLEEALELAEEVHAVRARLLPPEHPELLRAEGALAGARKALGDLYGARELEEHVLRVRLRTLPPEHPLVDEARNSLGGTLGMLGDLAGSMELAEQVLAVRARTLPAGHPDLLVAQHNLALARYRLGDFLGARELYERALAASEGSLPPGHPSLLVTRRNLASTLLCLGDVEGAQQLYEEVLAVEEERPPEGHPDRLRTEGSLVTLLRSRGEFERARELGERVLAGWERILPADHPELLGAQENLASACRGSGELDRALALEEELLAAYEQLLPADHPDLLRAYSDLAATHYLRGEHGAARAATRSWLEGMRLRAERLRAESPRAARSAALAELWGLSRALFIDRATGREDAASLDGLLFAVLESLRIVSTHSAEVALAVRRSPDLAQLDARLREVRGELSDLTAAPPVEAEAARAWRSDLLELTDRRDALERSLRTRLWEQGVFVESPTLESVAAGLEEEGVLVTFFRYPRHSDLDMSLRRAGLDPDHELAFVVTPAATVTKIDLGPSSELEALARRWRALLGQPVERGDPVAPASSEDGEEAIGRELRARLLDPCLAAVEGRAPTVVHLVLDDFLHLVPVEALPTEAGGRVGEVLAVRPEVSVLRLIAPERPAPRAGTLVALGGVDFDAAASPPIAHEASAAASPAANPSELVDRSRPGTRFEPLIQSRLEVEALSLIYTELHGGEPVLLTRSSATKERLAAVAPGARYLHVATHGWFAPDTLRSMLADVAPEQGELLAEIASAEDAVRGFAPETLCGLALAGANQGKDELGKVRGILTAEELATLDLSGCELAVLSACETNVGLRRAGQGIQSLQAALHAAGVRTAITSLWRVDDAATRRLMELFYTKLWKDGAGKADALWEAKMALRGEGHPLRDWAGWVLSGDPD